MVARIDKSRGLGYAGDGDDPPLSRGHVAHPPDIAGSNAGIADGHPAGDNLDIVQAGGQDVGDDHTGRRAAGRHVAQGVGDLRRRRYLLDGQHRLGDAQVGGEPPGAHVGLLALAQEAAPGSLGLEGRVVEQARPPAVEGVLLQPLGHLAQVDAGSVDDLGPAGSGVLAARLVAKGRAGRAGLHLHPGPAPAQRVDGVQRDGKAVARGTPPRLHKHLGAVAPGLAGERQAAAVLVAALEDGPVLFRVVTGVDSVDRADRQSHRRPRRLPRLRGSPSSRCTRADRSRAPDRTLRPTELP